MPPTPARADDEGPAPTSLARTRGHIRSEPLGRICRVADCETTLSRYNRGDVCWMHAQAPGDAHRQA
jgi:hypothetical protein